MSTILQEQDLVSNCCGTNSRFHVFQATLQAMKHAGEAFHGWGCLVFTQIRTQRERYMSEDATDTYAFHCNSLYMCISQISWSPFVFAFYMIGIAVRSSVQHYTTMSGHVAIYIEL